MSTTYKGVKVPEYTDHADGPQAFKDLVDGVLPLSGGRMAADLDMNDHDVIGVTQIRPGHDGGAIFWGLTDKVLHLYSGSTFMASANVLRLPPTQGAAPTVHKKPLAFAADVLPLSGGVMAGGIMWRGGQTGINSPGTSQLSFRASGVDRFWIKSNSIETNVRIYGQDGYEGHPAYAFLSDHDTGMWKDKPRNSLSFSLDAKEQMHLHESGMHVAAGMYVNDMGQQHPVGAAANVTWDAAKKRIRMTTSARRFKKDIESAPELADLRLNPVSFHHKGDKQEYLGFIADEVEEQSVRAAVYDEDGIITDYDLRAVVAILAAKVNRLEGATT